METETKGIWIDANGALKYAAMRTFMASEYKNIQFHMHSESRIKSHNECELCSFRYAYGDKDKQKKAQKKETSKRSLF